MRERKRFARAAGVTSQTATPQLMKIFGLPHTLHFAAIRFLALCALQLLDLEKAATAKPKKTTAYSVFCAERRPDLQAQTAKSGKEVTVRASQLQCKQHHTSDNK